MLAGCKGLTRESDGGTMSAERLPLTSPPTRSHLVIIIYHSIYFLIRPNSLLTCIYLLIAYLPLLEYKLE